MKSEYILDSYPNFKTAYSRDKLMSKDNQECRCSGGYCYAKDKEGKIVKKCDPKVIL